MICKNCGNNINEDAKFCPKCGAPVTRESDAGSSKTHDVGTTTANPQKKRRFWISIVIIVVVVVVVLIVLAATGVLTKKTVKLDNYVSVEFAGYDGHGTAEVSLDLYELGEDYDGKIKLSEEANAWGYYNFSELVEDIASVSVEPDSNLSNGDEVTVEWTIDQSYFDTVVKSNVELSYEPETVEVTDLEPVESVDVFEGINVEFSGISPDASASFSFDANAAGISEDAAHYLHFSLDKMEGLAIGDTVTITLDESSVEELTQDFGIYPTEMSKDYEVEDIPYYVSSLEQIPEDGMEKMKSQAEDAMDAQIPDFFDDPEWFNSMEYIGSYFLFEKSGLDLDPINMIYLVYKVHVTEALETVDGSIVTNEREYYWCCKFTNGMMLEDGTFTLNFNDYTIPEYTTDWLLGTQGTYFVVETDIARADGNGNYTIGYPGYENLDTLLNDLVASKVSEYTCENTVED